MSARLSSRQVQCLRLTAFRTDKEIAAHLGLSEATVKKHVHEACQRLGVNRRKAALALLEPQQAAFPVAAAPAESVEGPTGAMGRLGYRAPPKNAWLRLSVIGGLAVVLAALLLSLGSMISDFHRVVSRFDPENGSVASVGVAGAQARGASALGPT